jgi:class 3 adenylate cyclase/tetratricopeptide (TPR) repeat protein
MDVASWLQGLGLERYEPLFRDNEIDWKVLPKLTAEDLKEIGVVAIGHRRKLLEAIAALGAAAPAPALAATAPDAPAPADAERRQLTVMFCDLVGSTALSTCLDPEDLREVIGAYHRAVAGTVAGFDGFVAKYMGDGVLAYFGYPAAHEDDAEQAVRAGLYLAKAVRGLDVGSELQTRIGIATGLVVVGDVLGQGAAQEQAVVGETPNLAARLQALAEPGAVVIDATTRRLTGGLFEYTDLEPASLKGFAGPVAASRVLGESATRSRFEALRTASTPFVGRDEELALLERRWQQAKAGEGRVVLISGEPGIGKSRLAQTLLERIAHEPYTRIRCFCSPHRQDSALHPSITQFERAAEFRRDDTTEQRLDKLELLLAQATDNPSEAAPLIAELLSIPTAGRYPPLQVSPQKRREQTLRALLAQLEGLAARQPVLMLFEDVHWSDPTSIELLDLIVDRASSLRLLLIITFRPEFVASWSGQSLVSLLSLNRLPPRERGAIIAAVTGGKTLPSEVTKQIIDRTDGVPLFVEELTKAVIESGMLTDLGDHYVAAGPTPSLAIPDTLHASLLARLDRLAPVREVAQIGAALGRQFSHELISAVATMPRPQLDGALAQLVGAELIYRRGVPPDAEYTFKHALVQEAAYNSLLRSRRAALHARVVEVLCALDPRIEEGRPDLLAYHCEKAGFVERAVENYMRAGRQAQHRSAYVEARQLFSAASRLTAALPEGDARVEAELHALSGLTSTLQYVSGFGSSEFGRVAARAADLCELLPNPLDFRRVIWDLWNYHLNRCDFASALEESARLTRWGEERDDVRCHIAAHISAGITKTFLGEHVAGRSDLELAVSLLKSLESCEAGPTASWDAAQLGSARAHLARPVCFLGYPDQALTHATEAVEGCKRVGAMGHVAHCCVQRLRHFGALWEQSELDIRVAEALRLCREYSMPHQTALARVFEGYAIARRGDLRDGGAAIREGLADYAATGAVAYSVYYSALLAETYWRQGDTDEALAILTESLSHVNRTGERWCESELIRGVGEVHRLKGDHDAAECKFTQAVEIARGQLAKLFELRAGVSLARLWSEQDKRDEARKLLAPIYEWFTEGFDTLDLKEAKALLDKLCV